MRFEGREKVIWPRKWIASPRACRPCRPMRSEWLTAGKSRPEAKRWSAPPPATTRQSLERGEGLFKTGCCSIASYRALSTLNRPSSNSKDARKCPWPDCLPFMHAHEGRRRVKPHQSRSPRWAACSTKHRRLAKRARLDSTVNRTRPLTRVPVVPALSCPHAAGSTSVLFGEVFQ